jgi:SprT protein
MEARVSRKEATRRLPTDDLWRPEQGLPARPVLDAIAHRCLTFWGAQCLAPRLRVAYNPRLRSTLGRALLEEARVELNPRLLMAHPEELVGTLAHELAHLVVHDRYGVVAPHGSHFRALMRALGLSDQATHRLDVSLVRRRRRRYLYLHRCSDCGRSFIARSIRRGYYCIACGPGMRWDIFRAPATPQGRQALDRLERTGSRASSEELPVAEGSL